MRTSSQLREPPHIALGPGLAWAHCTYQQRCNLRLYMSVDIPDSNERSPCAVKLCALAHSYVAAAWGTGMYTEKNQDLIGSAAKS
jgi:hypothetical protein